jgi:hypothetical protein
LKNPSQKRAGGVAQGEGPEFKPQYRKKKKKNLFQVFVTATRSLTNTELEISYHLVTAS